MRGETAMTKRMAPLLPRKKLAAHVMRNLVMGMMLIYIALGIGMLGYHDLEHMSWIDSFVNAAMILSGMGPMGNLSTDAGKIFAGFYALFSGLAFILIVGIVFAPMVHRFIKTINIEDSK
jgi:hypothetical protein